MDAQTINLHVGLFMLILINVVLGSFCAIFEKRFDFKRFVKGVAKGAVVTVCFGGTYFVGYLNPSIIAFQVNDTDVDLLTALYMVVLAGYYFYAKQVIEKLADILKGSKYISGNGTESIIGDNESKTPSQDEYLEDDDDNEDKPMSSI